MEPISFPQQPIFNNKPKSKKRKPNFDNPVAKRLKIDNSIAYNAAMNVTEENFNRSSNLPKFKLTTLEAVNNTTKPIECNVEILARFQDSNGNEFETMDGIKKDLKHESKSMELDLTLIPNFRVNQLFQPKLIPKKQIKGIQKLKKKSKKKSKKKLKKNSKKKLTNTKPINQNTKQKEQ